jgi:hypothetical protein
MKRHRRRSTRAATAATAATQCRKPEAVEVDYNPGGEAPGVGSPIISTSAHCRPEQGESAVAATSTTVAGAEASAGGGVQCGGDTVQLVIFFVCL